jgi:predicted RNA-binding Zn-ribbon protein involved in translation (DUF1610 family)
MIQESSQRRIADVQARLLLVQAASEGKLDELRCPQCESQALSVTFSRSSDGQYRTWFDCPNCGFSMRAQNSGLPAFFSEERLRPDEPAASSGEYLPASADANRPTMKGPSA